MTERTEMDRFLDWCKGIGLDGSRDYRAIEAVVRFKQYENRIREQARNALLNRGDQSKNNEK